MNIFDVKLFDKYNHCFFFYDIKPGKRSESIYLVLEYQDEYDDDKNLEKKCTLVSNAAVLSNWLLLFGYENNEEMVRSTFRDLKEVLKIIPANDFKEPNDIPPYLTTLTTKTVSDQAGKVFDILKPAMAYCPLLACVYAICYEIFTDYVYYLKEKRSPSSLDLACKWLLPEYKSLSDIILRFDRVYEETRKYCDAVFRVDNKPGATISPGTITYIYREYCEESDISDYSRNPVLQQTPKPSSFKELCNSALNMPWPVYFELYKNSSEMSDDETSDALMITTEDIAYAGINYLRETESVLRTCKLCGKEFRIKYTSSQEYCTRPYGDTKAACNEYASRKSYKDKLFKHPIHQEFTKAYNKLYGRIRRGKVPQDTPLMDQLKRLHEEYYEKYEATHFKEREAVWKEYIEKNKELLS